MRHLEPEQLALSQAGGAKLVHQVRMASEANPDWVVVKVDFKNAHNEVARASVISAFEEIPSLKHLAWHCGVVFALLTGLVSQGEKWGDERRFRGKCWVLCGNSP